MQEKIQKNLTRCGEYFMYSVWIQSQLTDLIILNKNKNIIKDFIENTTTIPKVLVDERYILWKKDFKDIKNTFETEFGYLLTDQAKADLNTVYYIRNLIAHSHVSLARPYLFYVPGKDTIDKSFRDSMNILNKDDKDRANPSVILLNFSDDYIYSHNFNALKRLDEIFLEYVCKEIGIPHQQIR